MSRFSRIIVFAAAVVLAASCTSKARIEGTVADAPSSEVIVKLLNVNIYEVLDTVRTDASGKFSYKVDVEKGQPEFVYLFHKDTKVASLLLESGDKVKVAADTLGNYTVEGSQECLNLLQVEKDYASALSSLTALSAKIMTASGEEASELRRQLGQEYVKYYRDCVKYVMNNSHSLTVVPVLFQNFGADLPVFGQTTDAIHFKNASDSLEAVYPKSRYVKALRAEAKKRQQYLELETLMNSAEEIGYPDVELLDINAQKVKLSEVDAKVILVYFWSASNAGQKMFNQDFLKTIYEDYHKKGFEIYQISLDVDKAIWAGVVKEQKMPWINVCDSRGSDSPYRIAYNVGSLPAAFVIADGELVDGSIVDEASFRKLLNKLLK